MFNIDPIELTNSTPHNDIQTSINYLHFMYIIYDTLSMESSHQVTIDQPW